MYGENTQQYYLQLLLASTNRFFTVCNVSGGRKVWDNIALVLAIPLIPLLLVSWCFSPAFILGLIFVFGFLVAAVYVALKLCHVG